MAHNMAQNMAHSMAQSMAQNLTHSVARHRMPTPRTVVFSTSARRIAIGLAGTFLCLVVPQALAAQAPMAGGLPGAWVEANAFAQSVTNGFGNWQGAYLRAVRPSARDTWYADGLALRAFNESGAQLGVAHRHDWSPRIFQLLGVNVGSGASILPRARADGAIGLRFGPARRLQATAGLSYVKSVTTLSDLAGVASLAWYAPHHLVIDIGGRYNNSRPGNIQSHRISATTIWTPSARRTFSVRAIGGSEGWQIVSTGITLSRFHSQEASLAWREKLSSHLALSAQADWYRNPFYTRSGVTLGVARYW